MLIYHLLTCYRHRHTTMMSRRKSHRRSCLWLFFSYCTTKSDVLANISIQYIGYTWIQPKMKDDDHGKNDAVVMAEMRVMSVISSNQIVGGSSWSIYEGIWALKDGFEANYFLNNFMSAAPTGESIECIRSSFIYLLGEVLRNHLD